MVPNEGYEYMGILKLFLYFQWTWVGAIAKDDGNGERFVQIMLEAFSLNGICLAFLESIKTVYVNELLEVFNKLVKTYAVCMNSKANAVVIYDKNIIIFRCLLHVGELELEPLEVKGKVWILTIQMELIILPYQMNWDLQAIHGSLAFTVHSNEPPGFQRFLHMRNHVLIKEDGFIGDFWKEAFGCVFPEVTVSKNPEQTCSGDEKLESLPRSFFEMSMISQSYNIYNAVHAVAHALDAMPLCILNSKHIVNGRKCKLQDKPPWQVIVFQLNM